MTFDFKNIPPPEFIDPNCGLVKCSICQSPCVLYWLKLDIWNKCKHIANQCGGHICLSHVEEGIGRPLTLDDLDIPQYTATKVRGINHIVVDTLIGASLEIGADIPRGWCSMWNEYVEIGKKLGRQTYNAQGKLAELVEQAQTCFPNFRNPYPEK